MGLIKTAMMSGVAIYGVNKLAQTAQSRSNNNASAARREYSDRDYDVQRQRPLEFRGRDALDNRFVDSRDMQAQGDEPRQRLYLQDQRPSERQAYYTQAQYEDSPQYAYASARSAPAQYYSGQRSQPGFVDAESIRSDPREAQGGDGAEMLNMLAQQAKSMGFVGGKKGKKDKDSKGDFMESLMSRA